MELLLEFILKFVLVFPGAFIRWMFKGFKGDYLSQLEHNSDYNVLISVIFIGGIILLIKYLS